MNRFALRSSVCAVRIACISFAVASPSYVLAQTNEPGQNTMPVIEVTGASQDGFSTQRVTTTKSDKPLFETPQSISVVTRELIDARQATTVDEAIETVAGVTSSILGRRGWDDFSIRGQNAADTMYLDGLRIGQGNWVGQEVFGAERLEVVKGPASIYFGQVTPGGTVNIVSKRPRAEALNQIGVTVGSYGYRQGTFDFNRPLASENGKAAVRINGLIMNSDDPTDGVWFKNRYIAPSISLDFGARTDFTILAAINKRNYVRQQGLPLKATSLFGGPTLLPNTFNTGDYTVAPYEAEQKSIGYVLAHRFDNGWTLNQTYRHLEMDMTGQLANVRGELDAKGSFTRDVLSQNFQGRSDGLDTNLGKTVAWGSTKHSFMVGIDTMRDWLYRDSRRCAIASQNIYKPVYGRPVTKCAFQNDKALVDTTLTQTGFYLRDYIEFNDRLSASLSVRHDKARLDNVYAINASTANVDKSANTGHVGIIYKATPNIAPYISYATSFLPQTDLEFTGTPIAPEEGKQSEVGVKFLSDDKRLSASLAYYELKRRNVSQKDPLHPDFSIAIGEQRTKGLEAEIAADLKNGWQLSAALSLMDTVIVESDKLATIGQRIPNVPERTASFLANYRFDGALLGWTAGLGMRYVGNKASAAGTYFIPSYTVTDANVAYQGNGYRVQLNVKNLFDKTYFAGAANGQFVPVGNPRTIMLRTVFDF